MSAAIKEDLLTDSYNVNFTFIKDPMAMSKSKDCLHLHILAKP